MPKTKTTKLKALRPVGSSNDPNLTGIIPIQEAPVKCGDGTGAQCCYTPEQARWSCAKQLGADGKSFGETYGYSNISARVIPSDNKNFINCSRGQPYACYANTKSACPDSVTWPYNKKGVWGAHRPYYQPQTFNDFVNGDKFCKEKNGPNSVFMGFNEGTPEFNKWGAGCYIQDWTQQPLNDCCTPGSEKKAGFREGLCSPQTCFGKPQCDQTPITAQICSDKDNVAKDQGCIDTCLRSNDTNSVAWCNPKIKEFCQGKNLETEACRTFCSQDTLDMNPDLANYCDNAYVQYCQSTDYKTVDRQRQSQLCGCINSPLPQANCVDSKCTNAIAIKTKSLRDNKGKCPSNICIQQIYIDANGNPVIDIDRNQLRQICGPDFDPYAPKPPGPGPVPPGPTPNPPYEPPQTKSGQNLELLIGGPLVLVLVIVAFVFLFRR